MPKLKIAELYAGIGGVTTGFSQTDKYKPVFLNDIDPTAKEIYLNNFPVHDDIYDCSPIEKLAPNKILENAGGELDGLLGCPPCQGLSSVGSRNSNDARNKQILEMGRIAYGTMPKFIVAENVPALLNSKFYFSFLELLDPYYYFTSKVLNAAEYGVPQLRRRAIIIGYRKDLEVKPKLPKPTHGGNNKIFEYSTGGYINAATREGLKLLHLSKESASAKYNLVTVSEALDDLPSGGLPDEQREYCRYGSLPLTTYQRKMRHKGIGKVANHSNWNHSADMVKRMGLIKPGFCPKDEGHKRNEKYFSQAYGRLHPDGVSRTITTYFHNPGSGRFTHHYEDRTLTIREALRIQSFPDRFTIPGTVFKTEAERAAGNAFPPILAEKIASHIYKEINA